MGWRPVVHGAGTVLASRRAAPLIGIIIIDRTPKREIIIIIIRTSQNLIYEGERWELGPLGALFVLLEVWATPPNIASYEDDDEDEESQ